jgi:hypothetical protein
MSLDSDIKKLNRLRKKHAKLSEKVAALGNELIELTGNPDIIDELLAEHGEAEPPPTSPPPSPSA